MTDDPLVITWLAGTRRVEQCVEREGNSLIFGARFDGGAFQPHIKITFDDPKDQALYEREYAKYDKRTA